MTKEQRTELDNLLYKAFKKNEFEHLLSSHLNERLDGITLADSFKTVVSEVIAWAERRTRVADLVNAAVAERPGNRGLLAFRKAHHDLVPPPDPPEPDPVPLPPDTDPPPHPPPRWRVPALVVVVLLGTVGGGLWFVRPPATPTTTATTPTLHPPPPEPSPLDALHFDAIPPAERPDTVPDGLVAVLGSRHCRSWQAAEGGWFALRPDGGQIAYADEPRDYSTLDPTTGRRTTRVGFPFGNGPCVFSADGTRLLGVFMKGEGYGLLENDVTAVVPKGLTFLPLGKNHLDDDVPLELQRSADGRTLVGRTHHSGLVVFDWPGPGKLSVRCDIRLTKVGPYRVSPDGKTVAVNVKSDRTANPKSSVIELWDVSGKEAKRREFEESGDIDEVRSSSSSKLGHWEDGRPLFDFLGNDELVVMHQHHSMRVWSWQRGLKRIEWHRQLDVGDLQKANVIELRGSNGLVVIASEGKLFTTDSFTPTSDQHFTLKYQTVPTPTPSLTTSVEFSADGRRLLTRHADRGGSLALWEVEKNKLTPLTLTEATTFDHFGISPDGKTFLGGSPAGFQRFTFGGPKPEPAAKEPVGLFGVWDDLRKGWTREGGHLHHFRPLDPFPRPLTRFDFPAPPLMDPSSSVALSWRELQPGQTDTEREWRAWDLSKSPAEQVGFGSFTASRPLLVLAGGKRVVAEGDINEGGRANSLELWTQLPNSGGSYALPDKVERGRTDPPGVAVSRDGTLLATTAGAIYRIENDRFVPLRSLNMFLHWWNGPPAFSPDGSKVAFAGQVSVWDVTSGKQVYAWQSGLTAHKVLFAPDGRHLLTGNDNGTVFVVRLPAGGRLMGEN